MPVTRSSILPNAPIRKLRMSETAPMDEERRQGYLSAMGITLWEPRCAAVSGGEAAPVEPHESSPIGVQAVADERMIALDQSSERSHPEPAGLSGVASMDWDALAAAVDSCRDCGLCESRTRTVFGIGARNAELLLIGEAPGADEDRLGEPFVGRAGQLLTPMLGAIGLSREQVYIANVLKCRPPGNRDPKSDEVQHCEGYLLRQVELIRPRIILAVGRIAAQNLLCSDETIGRLRGRWFAFGEASIPLRVTYHPAYLLRSPDQKAKAWEDLVEIRRRLNNIALA